MRRQPAFKLAAALALILLAGVLGTGCAEKLVGPDRTVQVTVPFDAKAATTFRLTVTAADMDTLTAIMLPGLDVLVTVLEVPVGADRRFVTEALDDLGTILYRGEVVMDVAPVGALELLIDMFPVVPMLYISPHFPAVEMDSTFVLAVRAANLPGLNGLEATLNWDLLAPVRLDSVRAAPEVTAAGGLLSADGNYFSISGELDSFVDADGNGFLAHFHFSTFDGWTGEFFPVQFDLELLAARGVLTLLEDIHLDRSQLRLFRLGSRETIFGSPLDDAGFAVAALPDGDFLVAGAFASTPLGGSLAPFLARVGPDAAPRWQETYAFDLNWQEARGVAAAPDGSIYLAGNELQFKKAVGGSFVYRTDADGELLFQESLDQLFDVGEITCVAARPGGGVVVSGFAIGDGGKHRFFAVFDALGYEDHLVVYDYSTEKTPTGVFAVADGDYVAVGTDDDYSAGSDMALWHTIETEGLEADWIRWYDDQGNENGHALAQAADGGFFLAGSTDGQSAILRDMWVIRTDAAGIEQWRTTVVRPDNEEAHAVVATPDGGCVVAGHGRVSGETGVDVIVVRLDAGGNKVWERTYGGRGTDEAYGIARGSGGGYLVTGRTDHLGLLGEGGYDILLLRLDEAGLKVAAN